MSVDRGNLFDDAAAPGGGERCDVLLRHRNLVVERIVSSAAMEPKSFVQAQDEWVVLLRGTAVLEVAGERLVLATGDYVFLPAGTAHTVCSASEGALWLAVKSGSESHYA
ncbi:MAG TPA: cupin domain-containing protein [Burkholderiales bacterium]|nr:cupin domain-containing protein [Burkholderiales bacterium]